MPKLARAVLVQPEPAHQRLGAMLAGAHGDAVAVQQGGDVMRVRALHGEADNAATILRRADHAQTFHADKPASAWSVSATSCAAIASKPMPLHVVDGRTQTDHLDDRRRSGFELLRHRRPGGSLETDCRDHVAAAHERRHRFEQVARAHSTPDPGRAI